MSGLDVKVVFSSHEGSNSRVRTKRPHTQLDMVKELTRACRLEPEKILTKKPFTGPKSYYSVDREDGAVKITLDWFSSDLRQ